MSSKYRRKEVAIMQEVIREYLEQAKVGRKQVYKNMAVYPLLSDYSLGLEYILLNEALGSGVIEVIDWIEGNKADELSGEDVVSFKKSIFSCKMETHDSVGLGTDCRLELDKLTGFALALDGKVVHMCVFARLAGFQGKSQTSRMAKYSQRSRNRMQ
jgi:ARG and Rhodanese-Phosphatase-superfamily-associated Protein domain